MTARSAANPALAAFAVSAPAAVAALGAASWSGSPAMASAAIAVLAAASSEAVMLYGLTRAARATPPEPAVANSDVLFWTNVAAMLLLATSAGVTIRDGIATLHQSRPVAGANVALVVLGAISAVAAISLWRGAEAPPDRRRGESQVLAPRDDAGTVVHAVAMGHVAVLGASSLAAAGIMTSSLAGWTWAEGAASAAIGALLAAVAVLLALDLRRALPAQRQHPAGTMPAVEPAEPVEADGVSHAGVAIPADGHAPHEPETVLADKADARVSITLSNSPVTGPSKTGPKSKRKERRRRR